MTMEWRTAEYVFPGHPDKLCDAIADAVVQEVGRREPRGLCGVEVAVHRDHVYVTGQVAGAGVGEIDVDGMVRDVYRSAGYDETWRPSAEDLVVEVNLCCRDFEDGEDFFRGVADDQTISTGYAVDLPGTNFLPPEHWLAWELSRRVSALAVDCPELSLGPDGKLIVLTGREDDEAWLERLSVSVQQDDAGDHIVLQRSVHEVLEKALDDFVAAIPGFRRTLPSEVCVNGAGNFVTGGPEGDNGLSGKKLVVDAYGPRVPSGGGAWSGKDFYKADRAGGIFSRRIARAVVLAGAASECPVTLGFFPGDERARVFSIRDQNGRVLDAERWDGLFDLSLERSGDRYTGACDLVDIARFGHFTSADRPWEVLGFDDRPTGSTGACGLALVGSGSGA